VTISAIIFWAMAAELVVVATAAVAPVAAAVRVDSSGNASEVVLIAVPSAFC
jgi:hypothetical protein